MFGRCRPYFRYAYLNKKRKNVTECIDTFLLTICIPITVYFIVIFQNVIHCVWKIKLNKGKANTSFKFV